MRLARALLFNHPMKDQTTDSALERNPDEWKTGDEPMTDAQRSYLETDSGQKPANSSTNYFRKADASKRIDELRQRSPRLTGTE